MRTNANLFWILFGFFLAGAVTYVIWALLEYGYVEWVGTIGITLSAVLAAFIGFYLSRLVAAGADSLPEDREDANIEDGDAEVGYFSPWSWWPMMLAGSLAITFLGLAIAPWLSFIGVPLVLISLIGWVFEYYRGNFAR